MIEKKNSSPVMSGSYSLGSCNERSKKPKPIITRIIGKSKTIRWDRLVLLIVGLSLAVWAVALAFKPETQPQATEAVSITSPPAPTRDPDPVAEEAIRLFTLDGAPVDVKEMTAAWAMEAGFEQRYTITDAERYEIAQVVTAEAVGEPFAGKVAVAQCILQASEDDDLRPPEAIKKYKYAKSRPKPTQEALEAVAAVFDFGHIATTEPIKYFYAPARTSSGWHESQVYILTINNHKFFKEAKE